jgi:hypothetical protein
MMHAIAFAPHVPYALLWAIAAAGGALCLYGAIRRARGSLTRTLSLAMLILALANPMMVRQEREPLSDIAVIVFDRSQSMQLGTRWQDADKAVRELKEKLAREHNLDVRTVVVTGGAAGEDNGTEAFAALDAALVDVAPSRIAGAIIVSDGEVHDAPKKSAIGAPVNALIVGKRGEADRKLTVADAARYAIVGKTAKIVLRVDDLGGAGEGTARINLRIDGAVAGGRAIPLGRNTPIEVPIGHEGESVIEIEAEPGPAELTLQNNRAVVTVNGVRDRLRVLLISGEPNAGERVWRAFLKGDPSVDLVHFTILRPPEKQFQDPTPLEELSLIVFPTEELFVKKLSGFDLVIFDRYAEHGILPLGYFENIAAYVEKGGALLISAGPEFAGPGSIYRTPLAAVLPARPSGEIIAHPFKPLITDEGFAHPVTRALAGANEPGTPPSWGRWFRQIGAEKMSGQTVMSGGGKPLLVLDRVGKGRVAEMLSDQGWLWARGFEGGGPQGELIRRTAHWLMKEPQLEEEALHARIAGSDIEIERRTMAKSPPAMLLTDPSGRQSPVEMDNTEPGLWRGRARADALGLYRVSDGILSAVAAAGPLNPKEVSDMRTTADILSPVAEATGGATRWYADGIGDIRRVSRGSRGDGQNFALTENGATRVASVEQMPLLPPWLALLLLMGTLMLAWREEGR